MKKKRAIEILKLQRDKLYNIEIYKDETWVFQTASYVKDFFGKDSVEFIFLQQFKFTVMGDTSMGDSDWKRAFKDKDDKIKKFMDNCIETLANKGLPKKDSLWKIWLKQPENWWKILVFIVGTGISIAAIYYSVKKGG
jgi:hypothetical protein